MSVTDEIKNRLDIVDIVSETVQLRKSGRNYAGFCPFHSNTRSPAFYVFPETQTWRCFGACAEGGDLFSFVMKKENMDFKEALEVLARRAGVELRPQTPENKARKSAEEKQAALLASAVDYFHMLFLHAPEAEAARTYIGKRGLNDDTIATFQLGFALNSWDACRTHFNGQGYSDDELLAAGLLTENAEKQRRYDRFRNRLMIPIRDLSGRVVGFGARTLDPDGIPKYLNSPQTLLFDKSNVLFGLAGAKRHIREAREAVIVEGYMDVMQGWQAGYRNMVAQMGTALTEHQLSMLKRYTKRFVIALDADAAGIKATMRSLQVARETLDRDVEIRFDARGLVRHEGRLKADIKIVTLPDGKDPDDIIQEDPSSWPVIVAAAKPVVEYVIGMTTAEIDMSDPKAKSAAAQEVLPLISDVADPIEREHYRQMLARRLKVGERTLRLMPKAEKPIQYRPPEPEAPPMEGEFLSAPPPGRQQAKRTTQAAVRPRPLATDMRETNLLRHCLAYPRLLSAVDEKLVELNQPKLAAGDFSTSEDQALFPHLKARSERVAVVTIDELCDSLDEILANRVRGLMAVPVTAESERERLADRLVLSVLDWRLEKVKEQLAQLQLLFLEGRQDANSAEDLMQSYGIQLQTLRTEMHKLNHAKSAMSSVGRRK